MVSTSSSSLPYYNQRSTNASGNLSSSSRSRIGGGGIGGAGLFRMREKYFILLAVVVIVCVCYSGFIFLPDGPDPGGAYVRKALKEALKDVDPKQLVVPPPRKKYQDEIGVDKIHESKSNNINNNKILVHEDDSELDPHRLEDKRRLWEKINQDQGDQIPKPVQEADQKKLIEVASGGGGGGDGTIKKIDQVRPMVNDVETEKRRETVKQVSGFKVKREIQKRREI